MENSHAAGLVVRGVYVKRVDPLILTAALHEFKKDARSLPRDLAWVDRGPSLVPRGARGEDWKEPSGAVARSPSCCWPILVLQSAHLGNAVVSQGILYALALGIGHGPQGAMRRPIQPAALRVPLRCKLHNL